MGSALSAASGSQLLEEVTLSNLKYDMHDAKVMIPAWGFRVEVVEEARWLY